MKQFNISQQKWLKSFHLLFAAVWVTCGIVMLSLTFVADRMENGDQLYMLNYITEFIDMKILVPAAMLTLLTGLIYGIYTKWGFFKQRWLVFKWIVTVSIIVIGTVFTGPWIEEMTSMSKDHGTAVLQNSRYIFISKSQFAVGLGMNITLILTIFISVFKPWKVKKGKPDSV
jgi:uncharacterized membrane protein